MSDPVDSFPDHFRRVLGDGHYDPDFVGDFYARFMAKSPEIARRFATTDMAVQKTMLHDSLHYVLNFAHSAAARQYVQRIAHLHSRERHDIPPPLYELWEESLLETVAARDADYGPAVELAWRVALAPGVTYMKECYNQSTPS